MERPGVWERVRAFARGERDAELLYAYKRAGTQVHALLDAAERRRFGQAASGAGPFDMPAAVGLELVCIWNAFVLQTLGDRMLEADEADDPATAGFVPPVTYDQVQAYYTGAQRWLAHASRAGHDPSFTVPETLPAPLPAWSPVEPCPRAHLGAMLAALRALGLHAEAAMNELEGAAPAADQARLSRLRWQYAQAAASARYALDMYRPDAGATLHEGIETRAKAALEDFYRVGQLLSYPALLGRAPEAPRRAGTDRPAGALPGQPGFDPWVMTDPHTADSLRRDPQAARVIAEMWALDPDPRASLGLWRDIEAARARGAVTYARHPGGVLIGYYFCTPYAAIYEATQAVVIGDTPVPRGQRFTIECAAEGVRLGYPFKREVVLGQFRAAQIDYCDPDAPPPHDD
ncbi:hypothetical protein [uncultured Deinococcus sp.]|uniref:hypothetical protein n=1 Tax=uncultured Deinococcus sp. TaxID=158789 RepID=UPI0037478A6A